MRIGVISTTTFATPPEKYGGEFYFWLIAKGLAEMGHEVWLYATPGSKIPPNGKLRLIRATYGSIDLSAESEVWDYYKDEILEHDFIIDCSHNHIVAEKIRFFYPEHMNKIVNVLNGIVSNIPRPEPYNLIVGSKSWYECLVKGWSQYKGTIWEKLYGDRIHPVKPEAIVGIIPWATDIEMYKFKEEKEDYFLYCGRLTPYKGFHTFIRLARRFPNKKFIAIISIAVKDHKEWFEKYKPAIESTPNLEVKINVSHEEKIKLYQNAKAFIAPYESREPFGLVVIEAMSCGTPVIASHIGTMPEIIDKGGVLCKSFDEFVEAVKNIDDIDPKDARKNAKKFDYRNVVPKYLDVYKKLRRC